MKNIEKILVGIIIIIFAFLLFYKEQYWEASLLVISLIILLRIDELTEFALEEKGIKAGFKSSVAESNIIESSKNSEKNVALVSYKIASILPNSIGFNFLKDWKVWFWIGNFSDKKYKAYIKIKFITDNLPKGIEVIDGYYGGNRAWKLDAFHAIQAPGLEIPEEIKNEAKKGERIKIKIDCEVKDEEDQFIEKKFPQTYIYDSKDNNWFLEP